jgi:arylsulfatase A-like enzyme
VKQSPDGDNTLVFLILGDNGCSAEGGLNGTINNMATQNGFPDDVAAMLKVIDEIGGPKHENHFSVGWAWALDTPFQWTKQHPQFNKLIAPEAHTLPHRLLSISINKTPDRWTPPA